MIFGIVGEGGTGKSAITVAMALEHLKNYDYIFTNIKGFNKNNSVTDIALALNVDIKIVEFENNTEDFKQALNDIEVLQADNNNDEKFKILFMYDECHKSLRRYSHLKEEDVYFSDFLSESRHQHTDFYFLTQGFKKIADMYKGDFKAWYLSVDDQLKDSSSHIVFKKMDKDCKTKIGVKRFKTSTKWRGKSGAYYKVFDCYDSGDSGEKQQKQGLSSLFKKKLIVGFILLLTICSFYYSYRSVHSTFFAHTSGNPNVPVSNEKSFDNSLAPGAVKKASSLPLYNSLKENIEFTKVVTSYSSVTCLFNLKNKTYIFPNRVLTQKNFDSLKDILFFKIIDMQMLSENLYRYEFLIPSNLLQILTVGSSSKRKKAF